LGSFLLLLCLICPMSPTCISSPSMPMVSSFIGGAEFWHIIFLYLHFFSSSSFSFFFFVALGFGFRASRLLSRHFFHLSYSDSPWFSVASTFSSSSDILSSIKFSLLERLSTELFFFDLWNFSFPELQYDSISDFQ
jgi:hypothetical protein